MALIQSCKIIYFLLIGCALLKMSVQESKLEYAAAVVEYRPSNETDPIRYAEDNTKVYIEVIQSNETALADIIVFPEATLNRQSHPAKLPKAGDEVAPCDTNEFSDIIKNISCAARQSNKYVVINLYMQRNCKDEADETNDPRPCSRGDLNIYNTAVAFDRNGTVVAIYRKFNLFMEGPEVRRTLEPDVVTFDTDFGVKFGLIICFDLNLQNPVADLLNQKVVNFVFPTMWWSELPFYTAAQIQQSWAYGHAVNLLAAGASKPGITGSGIHSGELGALRQFMADAPTTKVLLSHISKRPHSDKRPSEQLDVAPTLSNAPELWQENLDKYQLKALDFDANATQAGKLCDGKICCEYNITARAENASNGPNYYSYAVGVFDGRRTFGSGGVVQLYAGTRSCSIIACKKKTDRRTCGQRFPIHLPEHEKYTIEHIRLVATVSGTDSNLIMPSTVSSRNLLALTASHFTFDEINDESSLKIRGEKQMEMVLMKPQTDLLTFAVLVRDFSRDEYISDSSQQLSGRFLIVSSALGIMILYLVKFN